MKLNVIKQRSLWWTISGTAILIGLIAMVISWQQIGSPLRPSIDFVGGTRLQLQLDCSQPNTCEAPIDLTTVRNVLAEQGLGSSSLQLLGENKQAISIRTSVLSTDERTQLLERLGEAIGQFDTTTTQIDTVGPTIGRQIFSAGILALSISFLGITAYLSLRFQTDYAIFALVALVHDVLITVGFFALLGLVWGVEVDSLFIVALLTIVGFSVNDTVVIYDRVRENLKYSQGRSIDDIVDDSVNQTLSRSINTTLTTTLSLIAIFLFGGETLKYFALAMIVGFISGAYSSIFIASTLLALWRKRSSGALPSSTESDAVSVEPSISDDRPESKAKVKPSESQPVEIAPIIEAEFIGTSTDDRSPTVESEIVETSPVIEIVPIIEAEFLSPPPQDGMGEDLR